MTPNQLMMFRPKPKTPDDDDTAPVDGQSQTYAPIVTSNPTETPVGDDWTNILEPVVHDLTDSSQTNTPQLVDTHSKNY